MTFAMGLIIGCAAGVILGIVFIAIISAGNHETRQDDLADEYWKGYRAALRVKATKKEKVANIQSLDSKRN